MLNLNQQNFSQEIVNYKGVVVADFYADWCGPCRMLSPILEEMDKNNKDQSVKFVKINVDQNQELAALFNVMSIPTIVVFKDGKKVSQQIGVAQKADYENLVKKALEYDPTAKKSNEVTVFSTPTCPYCHMAKSYLKEKNIPFREVDVSVDRNMAMEMVGKSGQMGVPQLWINDEVVVGFNKPVIDQLLGI